MGTITVSREYGSNGAAIARQVASKLGYRYVDKEIVQAVARRAGVPLPDVEALDQAAYGWASSLIHSVLSAFQEHKITQESYTYIAGAFIRELAAAGDVVIVGQAGQVVLGQRPDVLHVNIVAPMEDRITEVARREGIDRQRALRRIQEVDQARARYVMKAGKRGWQDPSLYDLTVNSHGLTPANAAEVIIEAAIREGVVSKRPADGETIAPHA